MKRIASFCINHDVLTEGMYTSRIDGDVVTYDLRFVRPNTPPFMENGGLHTLEHLFATYVRNSAFADRVIYFGPMGCRTGCYFLVRDMAEQDAIDLVRDALAFTAAYDGEIPGSTKAECGNYLDHDLNKAKEYAAFLYGILRDWTPERLIYPS